jgi:hypothetical protein
MDNYTQHKEKTFRDIVLSAVEKVLEIYSKELRLYKRVVTFGMQGRSDLVLEEEDTRESFCQAIHGLALILQPYFDKEMDEVYEGFDELCDMSSSEFYTTYKEMITKRIDLHKEVFTSDFKEEDEGVDRGTIEVLKLGFKVRSAKIVFRELNKLLKRQDYLKNAIYGDSESDDEVVEDDKDGDE